MCQEHKEKHGQFMKQKIDLTEQLSGVDLTSSQRLDPQLILLELSQKAAEIYAKKQPEQKRLIITKLFKNLTFEGESLSVNFTNFAQRITSNSEKSRQILGGEK